MSEKKSLSVVFGVIGIALGAFAGSIITYLGNRKKVFYKPGIGEDICRTIKNMMELTKLLGKKVWSRTGGITFKITPGMTEDDAHALWRKLSAQKTRSVA